MPLASKPLDLRPDHAGPENLIYLCDWLPPDYGAVGQYSSLFARELAAEGRDVTLVGLSSREASETSEVIGSGRLREIRILASTYDKTSLARRLLWTAQINTRLIWRIRRQLQAADTILFTGSPPYLLHWIAPLNILLRKKLIYRITDFHPECLMAQRQSSGVALRLLYRLTMAWRRRVDEFEVLGNDQLQRLVEAGIPRSRARLKRDPSPVRFESHTKPLPRPAAAQRQAALALLGELGRRPRLRDVSRGLRVALPTRQRSLPAVAQRRGERRRRDRGGAQAARASLYSRHPRSSRSAFVASRHAGCTSHHAFGSLCRLCFAIEGACLHPIGASRALYRQRPFRRARPVRRAAEGPLFSRRDRITPKDAGRPLRTSRSCLQNAMTATAAPQACPQGFWRSNRRIE